MSTSKETNSKETHGLYGTQKDVSSSGTNSSTTMSKELINSSGGPLPAKVKPEKPLGTKREGIERAFVQFAQWIQASRHPVVTQNGPGSYSPTTQTTGLRNDLKFIGMKDVKTVLEIVKSKLKGEQLVDDKTMIMERTIQLVAGLPHSSRLRVELTDQFLNELWDTLDHPPLLYVGDKFRYRMADGSWNNPMNPQLGAAGSTYARTCRPGTMPKGALPDPELIFESVMKRTKYRKHPNNVSSVLWYWATIIIHDLFWTDLTDMNKTRTSSYLDLSPLYGSNQEMQDSVRTFKDGMMKPDTFADKRLLGQPPGVSVLLVMFNRFHNYVAGNLAAINEGGRFSPPTPGLDEEKAAAAWKKHDNDLFQTARLVTSGLYINITLVDYVRNIVNLNRSNTTWTLDPRAEMGSDTGTFAGSERGTGSMVSAEFNLAYRWHSCISAKDDQWVQDFYRELFGKDPLGLSIQDMVMGFGQFEKSIPSDPGQREFGGFKRNAADGRFSDDDLVGCIADAVEDCAGAFGGRNVPPAMKPVEILGILQGRKWQVANLNEFRKHFGLKPYRNFEDINSDPQVADSLRFLYGHPDFVELYPGLVAEEDKKPMVPGVGIAPTYTISRVILSDAVCLTRGDRFYTTDYNPRYLTSWGFNEVSYDLNVNQGCVFYKLFLRAFPNHFKPDSVYAHYPMCVPIETKKILTNLGRVQNFSFDRPSPLPPRVAVTTYGGAQQVLEDQGAYKVPWQRGLSRLMGAAGGRFMLAGDSSLHAGQRRALHAQLYNHNKSGAADPWHAGVKAFYARVTAQLVRDHTTELMPGRRFVDVVRDVGNLAPAHFAARALLGGLPLRDGIGDPDEKKKKNDNNNNKGAAYDAHELYQVLAVVHACALREDADRDPARAFPLGQAAKTLAAQLGALVEQEVSRTTGLVGGLLHAVGAGGPGKDDPLAAYGANLVRGLAKAGLSSHDIAWSQLLPTACAAVPTVAEVFAQSVDFYLSDQGAEHLPELHRIASLPPSGQTDSLLLGYCMEGVRLAGAFGACREAAADGVVREDDGRQVSVKAGDRVFMSYTSAASDAKHFPRPGEVNPRRPLNAYLHFGRGPHACLGRDAAQVALGEMFRAVFRLRNLRRAPGPQGELKKVVVPVVPGGKGPPQQQQPVWYMKEDREAYFPFPCTMVLCYDA
ncbi:linoleate diol synthase [Xylariaceae sp. FL0804]|nr:linoleate diol synthase [Xylariaceae sp. FL0804]